MERARPKLEQHKAVALSIGAGGVGAARLAARMLRLTHPLLADRDRDVYRRFGFDRVLQVLQRSGSAVVDKSGVIRYLHRTSNPRDALRLDEILRIVGR